MATSDISITAGVLLSDKILDACWRRWMALREPDISVHLNSYKHVSRRNKLSIDFENWLFVEGNGAVVRQHYSNRYLEFPNNSAASMFVLKWAS